MARHALLYWGRESCVTSPQDFLLGSWGVHETNKRFNEQNNSRAPSPGKPWPGILKGSERVVVHVHYISLPLSTRQQREMTTFCVFCWIYVHFLIDVRRCPRRRRRRLNLSTRVFGTGTATGSELFSLLTCPHASTFTLLSIVSPLDMSIIKNWGTNTVLASEIFSSGCRPPLKNARAWAINSLQSVCTHVVSSHIYLMTQKKVFASQKSSSPSGLIWDWSPSQPLLGSSRNAWEALRDDPNNGCEGD